MRDDVISLPAIPASKTYPEGKERYGIVIDAIDDGLGDDGVRSDLFGILFRSRSKKADQGGVAFKIENKGSTDACYIINNLRPTGYDASGPTLPAGYDSGGTGIGLDHETTGSSVGLIELPAPRIFYSLLVYKPIKLLKSLMKPDNSILSVPIQVAHLEPSSIPSVVALKSRNGLDWINHGNLNSFPRLKI